jgi:dihydrofolate reductase
MAREFDMIAAVDEELGIARGGDLPWNLPGDVQHFKRTTTLTRSPGRKNAVIMGRKTWDSIPPRYRPLAGRKNLVVSRSGVDVPEGVLGCASLEEALARLNEDDLAAEIERIFVVGGGEIYGLGIAMPECRRLYITRVMGRFECDTFFPEFESRYQLESVLGQAEENGVPYRIEIWRDARAAA